jgi:hypothetical protein
MTKDLFVDLNHRSGPSPSSCLHVRPNSEFGGSMTNLSPAAQAVLDAIESRIDRCAALAAALRAVAVQVTPLSTNLRQNKIRYELLAIADELETQ